MHSGVRGGVEADCGQGHDFRKVGRGQTAEASEPGLIAFMFHALGNRKSLHSVKQKSPKVKIGFAKMGRMKP